MVFITVCISEHGVIFPLRKSIFRCNVFGNLVTGLFLRVQLRDTWLDNQIEMSWNVIVDCIHVLSLMSVWAFEVVCRSLSLSAPHVVSIHLFHFKHSCICFSDTSTTSSGMPLINTVASVATSFRIFLTGYGPRIRLLILTSVFSRTVNYPF